MIDYINGNKFADLADFVILKNNFPLKILKENCIIFCTTDYLDFLFKNLRFSNRKFILITHASDFTIDFSMFSKKPPCIKKWFAENAEYNHPDLIPIPIGLENTKDENGCGKGQITEKNLKLLSKQEYFKKKKKIKDTVFCGFKVKYQFAHNTWINPWRKTIIEDFQKTGVKYYQPKEKLSQYNFLNNLSDHKFIVAPRGNGIDTHRAWEALYVYTIPIVLNNNVWKYYNLPILKVNKWIDVTSELLFNYLEEIKDNDFNNYEQLTMTYWKNKIINEFNKLNE